MDKYNFIFLIPHGAFGGLEMQMVKRTADASKFGYDSLLITFENSRIDKYALENNVKTDFIETNIRYIDPKAIFKLGGILKKNNTDICIVGKSIHLSLAISARNWFSKKTAVILYQQLESVISKKDYFHNWVYRNLDAAITLTSVMKNDLQKFTVITEDKIETIPYGIDLKKFNPVNHDKKNDRKKFNLPENAFLIGLPGRISEAKGQAVAIEALSLAAIENTYLVLCGDPGSQENLLYYKNIAKEKGIEQKLIHIPFTYNIPDFMNAMDISLLPSKREAFGLVVIEAMASGLPVIGTNAGGVPEIIHHNENGLLFEPYDSLMLAEYIRLLYYDMELRERLGRQARIDSENRYIYDIQSKKFFDYSIKVFQNRQSKLLGNKL